MSVNTALNNQPTHQCTFCGITNATLKGVMISDPGVNICQECVLLCVDLVFGHSAKHEGGDHREAH
ncbi:ClpX C4-type zinc finger protein [Buttiauxella sp.]|uniref:ClpX C4-type zinc finger protein n=1 Tax=Buttiauxella sp. TaxID=1972222 RepID=UPI003C75B14B